MYYFFVTMYGVRSSGKGAIGKINNRYDQIFKWLIRIYKYILKIIPT